MRRTLSWVIFPLALLACDKKATDSGVEPAASAAAPSEPEPPPPPPKPTAWTGKYVAQVGEVNPPANARNKVWQKDPGTANVGDGTVEVSLDEKTGTVKGTATGALGELQLSGELDDTHLRANVAPKDPNAEDAMTGFLVLDREGDTFKGSLRVSDREGVIVREAKVELQPNS